MAELHGHGNVNNAQHAPDRQHDDHGNKGLPGAAQHAGDAVGISEQEVKERDRAAVFNAPADRFLSAQEKANERPGKEIDQQTDQLGEQERGDEPETRAALCSFVFAGTEILVESAMEKLVIGRKAKPSILE